jgi:rod shape determining protein RodA
LKRSDNISESIDWLTIGLYGLLVLLGWLNIFASVYTGSDEQTIWDLTQNSGRQLMFIAISIVLIVAILTVDLRFFEATAYLLYALIMFLVFLVPFIGKEVGGNKAWLGVGSFGIQPSEFAKFITALVVARILSLPNFRFDRLANLMLLLAVIFLPIGLILLQKDWGTAFVFLIFFLVFFREGMSPIPLLIGLSGLVILLITLLVTDQMYLHISILVMVVIAILAGNKKPKRLAILIISAMVIVGIIESSNYVFEHVLKPHHQNRIRALFNPELDPLGYGWNVTQSKIAIGSGGFSGKGFLKGTQTKFDFVPEQDTDFIFCTIGEEHGWIGSLIVIGLFTTLFLRLLFLAERQKNKFSRIYIYATVCILFFHFAINIAMTIGLFPVIGIPLPFFSYGGSSLMAFTILLFIAIKLDAHRSQVLQRI